MDFVLKFNRIWVVVLTLVLIPYFLDGTGFGPYVFLASLLYLVISFFAVRKNKVSIFLVFLVSGLVMLRWLPMVMFNFYLSEIDDPVYLDSPGTIIVVFIYGLFFAFPSAYIFFSGLYHYQTLSGIVLGKPFSEFSDKQRKSAFLILTLVSGLSFLAFSWHIQALASKERVDYPSEKETFDE